MLRTLMQRPFPLSLVCLSLLAATAGMTPEVSAEAPSILAIAGFDFRDTSGEVRDQDAEHRKRLEDVAATLLAELDVTYPQYLVLLHLWQTPETRVTDICSAMGLDTGTLSPLLKRLEKTGYIRRDRSAEDERRRAIQES